MRTMLILLFIPDLFTNRIRANESNYFQLYALSPLLYAPLLNLLIASVLFDTWSLS